ncbi:MAG: adenylate cyclase [Verrucomicrobiota bacterium]
MSDRNFFSELKRRNVYKVAVAYAVVSWLLIQIATQVFPFFEVPNWAVKLVVLLLIIGFPVTLIFSWAFEITPEGIPHESEIDPDKSIARRTGRRIVGLTAVAGAIAAGLVLFQLVRTQSPVSKSEPELLIPNKSIAVLPFVNLSEEKANAYFADGVQDQILTNLAKIADLKVISRTSVMQYRNTAARNLPEIAQALKVAHVLEGSVQRSTNRVRVSAQLINARNDTHVWAETYDRDLADVFAIQSEIAQTIAEQLQAKLSPKEKSVISDRPTTDLAAYDLYLRAKELIYGDFNTSRWKENALKAVQLLEQAVARDPAFLPAFCQLAFAHDRLYFFHGDRTEARLALAETNVRAAVRLQPDAGETHLAQAIHFYWGYRDYDRARTELAKAQTTLPNNERIFQFLGLIARRQGRWDEAVRSLERVLDLDPRNADALGDLGDTYFDLRRYGEAIAVTERSLALRPGNAFLRASIVSVRAEADANLAPLRATLQTIEAEGPASAAEVTKISFETARRERDPAAAARALANISKDSYTNGLSEFPHPFFAGTVAELRHDAPGAHAAFMDARIEAEQIVRLQPKDARPLSVLALTYAKLGDKEQAIRAARTACDMLPVSKDAMGGVRSLIKLAAVYALTGEKDLALEQLEIATRLPGGPTYGNLRLGPEWDSLRGDPRFEKIIASLAPKGAQP